MQRKHTPLILLVDDAPENLMILRKLLERLDVELVSAKNGKEGVDKARELKPDLILLDIMMPVMDGYEACKVLKADPETSSVSIIFLTALSNDNDIVKGFELGAVDYLSKPFRAAELIARVKNHLKISRFTHELEVANNMKNKFFSIIAHDLKNPFSTITGFAEMLIQSMDSLGPVEMKKYLRLIYNSGKDASDLLDNLLQWSHLQTGTFEVNMYNVDSAKLINRVVSFLEPMSRRKNIQVSLSLQVKADIYIDENMLETVLRNIGSNAIKFTHEGGKVEFRSGFSENNDFFNISVEDNGIGMPPEVQESLFRIDSRQTMKGTSDEEGSGLGMLLSNEFVAFLGGCIEFESEEGKGTTFVVKLPVQEKSAGT